MSHLPRLHPEDLDALAKGVADEIASEIVASAEKATSMNDLMTFTVDEVAVMYKTTPQTIAQHCKKGLLKAERFGREWRISKQTLIDNQNGNKK